MALRYGFFDSEITGYNDEGMPEFDRAESSDFLADFISSIVRSGVLAVPGDGFQVMAGEGMTVQIRPGFGVIAGRFARDDETSTVVISAADSQNMRIDRVILRANYPERLCEIIVRAGAPAANPQPPELQSGGDYDELCLAEVSVRVGQTSISQSDIVDTRADTSICGWVTQAIQQVDTSTLFMQWQDAYQRFYDASGVEFTAWLDGLKEELGDSVVGTLTGAIAELQSSKTDKTVSATMAGAIAELQSGKADKTTVAALSQTVLGINTTKGDKASVKQATVPASGWLGDIVPYQCTVQIPGVTAASIIELGISSAATKDQARAWLDAQIVDGGQGENSITLKAFGWKPAADIPINVAIWN
jgi:hypothetical protein